MTLTQKLGTVAGFLVVFLAAKYAYDRHQREIGKLSVLLEQSEKSADSFREASRINAGRYAKAVKTFTRLKTRTDTLRDSLVITDTVKVKEYVAAADSTIKACSLVVLTCENVQNSLKGQIAAQDTTIGLLKRSAKGSKLSRIGNAAILLGVGIVVGNVVTNAARK